MKKLLLPIVLFFLVGCTSDTVRQDDNHQTSSKKSLSDLVEGKKDSANHDSNRQDVFLDDEENNEHQDASDQDKKSVLKELLSDETEDKPTEDDSFNVIMYNGIISEYEHFLNTSIPLENSNINMLTLSVRGYADIMYTYADITKNGVPELIIAGNSNGQFNILDLYTIENNSIIKLTNQSDLTMLGERMSLTPLEDGTLLYKGSSGAADYIYKIFRYDTKQHVLVEERSGKELSDLGTNEPQKDLSQYDWHQFNY